MFADLKLNDIPNTCVATVKSLKDLKLNYLTIVTIFINPLQFNNKSDLNSYPVQEKNDISLLKKHNVNVIFIPTLAEVYPKNYSTYLHENSFSKILCGKHRKNHFFGVTTIVLKLFLLIKPNFAFFGEKDFQQLIIISKIVKDLNLDIKIIKISTVRDSHGLALSSRNYLFNKNELKKAGKISTTLFSIKKNLKNKKDIKNILKEKKYQMQKMFNIRIEYLELRNVKTLLKSNKIDNSKIFIAYYLNDVRLIDNF